MRSTYEDQPSYLAQTTTTDATPMIAGGGTLLIGVLVFLAKWGFTQLSNDLKEKISGLQGSIEKLNETQQQFSIEYVRKVEFDRELLKIETQTENTVSRLELKLEKLSDKTEVVVSRLETKLEKLSDKIEQLLIKERGN
jgi:TolA-binding protein